MKKEMFKISAWKNQLAQLLINECSPSLVSFAGTVWGIWLGIELTTQV